ncbi:hypothetical protein OHS71_00915 [Streptomyces sp. NBC_00377]|uniref:hypothetical protein n=1 Tax=unclassified Streptomyces TaxID=2593676 RepID=UPI002E1D5468|nr:MULTISPECIES: hypothetical protein [unclassified Streptomyces]
MYGKAGLPAELEHFERACKEDGAFALLHDLTNCLRIGDMTVWDGVHPPRTQEIKTNPKNSRSVQLRRINQARAAVLEGVPLPGDNASELLYDLDLPLRTHLDVLRDALERAATDGIYATPVPGSRALFVVDQYACSEQGMSSEQFNERHQHAVEGALQRAGIAAGREDHNIYVTSLDSTARDPLRVPWANYPLHPVTCARLIGDYAVATVETSGPVLTRLLQATGLDARWVRPPDKNEPPRRRFTVLAAARTASCLASAPHSGAAGSHTQGPETGTPVPCLWRPTAGPPAVGQPVSRSAWCDPGRWWLPLRAAPRNRRLRGQGPSPAPAAAEGAHARSVPARSPRPARP